MVGYFLGQILYAICCEHKTALKSKVIIFGGGGLELDWMQKTSEEHLTVAQVSKNEDLDEGSSSRAGRER